MIPGSSNPPGAGISPVTSLHDIVAELGLMPGCKVLLDFGDIACWPGSGQLVYDRSGTGSNFSLGTNASDAYYDPAFSGTPGGRSRNEYFYAQDAARYFTIDGTANPAWVNGLHHPNSKFTIAIWGYANNISPDRPNRVFGMISTMGYNAENGIDCYNNTGDNRWTVYVNDGDTSQGPKITSITSPQSFNDNAWNMLAATIDLQNLVGQTMINGAISSASLSLLRPPANTDAGYRLTLMGKDLIYNAFQEYTGNRAQAYAIWDRALSAGELGLLATFTREKYGFA